MSREAGRVRALLNAARVQHLLQSRERLELLGCVLVPATPSGDAAAGPGSAAGAWRPASVERVLHG